MAKKYKFGVGTDYYKANKLFEFYLSLSGDYVYGTELTLYTVSGGNLGMSEINENDFPD